MVQIQAYQGYIHANGQLVLDNVLVEPPKNKRVTIFWEEEIETGNNQMSQKQTLLNVLSSLDSVNKEGFTPEDLESFERLERGDFALKLEERLP